MSGPGPIVVHPVGAAGVAAPTQLAPSTPIALSTVFGRSGQFDIAAYPNLRALALANGVDFQYHLLDSAQYLTGPRAPYTAPTMDSTAVKATKVVTFAGNPTSGNLIQVWNTSGGGAGFITFLTTLTATARFEVKRDADPDVTLANLYKLLTNTGIEGTNYSSSAYLALGGSYASAKDYFNLSGFIEASAYDTAANTITFRYITAGTQGNAATYTNSSGDANLTATGAFTGGANGTGTAPEPGTYDYGYRYVRLADEAETATSLTSELITGGSFNTTAATLDAPATRDGIDLYQVLRSTTDGGAADLYPSVESASAPITDTNTDAQILRDGNVRYDPNIVRPYLGGYPVRYKCHASHLGCMFGAGAYLAAKQNAGTVTTVLNNRTVTIANGPILKTPLIGRTFRITSQSHKYVIVDVPSASTLLLNEPYLETGAGGLSYEILDERDPFILYYSVPLLLNNWPVENSLEGEIHSDDPRGITALRSMWGNLAVFTRTGTWRVLGSPDTNFRMVPQTEGSGCFNNRCLVDVGGSLFWIGADGVQAWDGSGDPQNLSKPRVGQDGQPTGIEATIKSINPLAVEGACGNYNPDTKVIRWAVPVDGSMWNNKIIQFNLQTASFTLLNCDAFTSMDSLVGPTGRYVTVAGDMYGGWWQLDNGYADGAYGFENVQAVTAYSATTNTITVAGTPFPTAANTDLRGVPVLLISADGTRQRCSIGSNTSSTLVLTSPPDTAPLVGSQIVVGGIFWRLLSSKFSAGSAAIRKTVSSLTMQFATSTAGQVWCAASVDNNDPLCFSLLDGTVDFADLTDSRGKKGYELRRGPGRTVQIELFALAPGFDLQCIGLEATLRTRDQVPR